MKAIIFISLVLSIILFTQCNRNNPITKAEISGHVQKGPFLNGTAIEIYELDEEFNQTGKSFSTQILDNSGQFQFSNVSLISPYILIKATGFYYNEVSGENSISPISLYALSDISDINTVNVNILTHLEKSRVEYLIQAENKSYADARQQAKQEILAVFSLQNSDISDFENLSISSSGDDNSVLLAVSLIMQGFRTESELSDLLANLITDIRDDGELNSATIGAQLINDARLLNLNQIRQNLETRYESLGLSVSIPAFEDYVANFVNQTPYEFTNNIDYPQFLNYNKENLLFNLDQENMSIYTYMNSYSLAANLPRGTSLKVTIESEDPSSLPNSGFLGYEYLPNSPVNFQIDANSANAIKSFTTITSDTHCEIVISFSYAGEYLLKVYENGSENPTAIKNLSVFELLPPNNDFVE